MTSKNENEQTSLYKLFVYGTLKRGEPSHYRLMNRNNGYCRFVGDARLVNKYPLVIASTHNVPFLLAEEGVGHHVQGEVYEIDDPMLKMLDAFEGHPQFYTRKLEPVEVRANETSKIELVWVYLLCEYRSKLLKLQYYENYTSSGDHNTPYMESDDPSVFGDVYGRSP